MTQFFPVLTFRARVVATALLATVPAMVAAVIFIGSYQSSALREQESDELEAISDGLARTTEAMDRMMSLLVRTLASSPHAASMDAPVQRPVLQRIAKTYDFLTLCSIVSPDGRSLARHDAREPIDYFDRKWFKRALAGERIVRETVVSRTTGQPAVVMASPVYSPAGSVIGVAVIGMDLTNFTKQLGPLHFKETGQTFVVNEQAAVLASADPQFGSRLTSLAGNTLVDEAIRTRRAVSGTFLDPIDDAPWLGRATPLSNGWTLMTVERESEFLGRAHQLTRTTVGIAILCMGAAGIMAWLLASRLLRPVRELTEAARSLSDANWQTRVSADSSDRQDELGVLARTFNFMADQLAQTYINIENEVRARTSELSETNGKLVTEVASRKHIEYELRRAKMQLTEALESLDAGLVMYDRDERLVICNRQYRDLYSAAAPVMTPGTRYEEILRHGLANRADLPPADWETWIQHRLHAHRTRSEPDEHKVGDRWIRINDRRTADGGVVSLRTDITAMKRTEVELRHARDLAQAANSAKSAFLANMSHEIRTPMTAILGYTDLMLDPSQTPDQREDCARTIRRNGEHLLAILNDILDLSKIEAGKLTLDLIPTSPFQIVEEVASLMRVRATGKRLSLDLHYDGSLPEVFPTDPTRVKQILMNLVGNAIKFTEAGGVTIKVRFEDAASGSFAEPGDGSPITAPPVEERPERLVFEVSDTGVGIDDETAERLFRPFEQADSSTARRFGGTGLGLAISKRLAEMLGGGIVFCSAPHRGSTFSLVLPVGATDSMRLIESYQFTHEAKPAPTDQPLLSGVRVLLAEDAPDNQRLVAFHLRRAGATVEIAADGQQAIEAIDRRPSDDEPPGGEFDLILMDIQMPVLDGYEATRRLRAGGCTLPIIALTAHSMSGDRDKCLQAGCTDYATKPIDAAALIRTIAQHAQPASLPPVVPSAEN